MTIDKDNLFLEKLVNSFKEIDGVSALVLGGSRAKETHHSGSDYDLGLYYDPKSPPDLSLLQNSAKYLDDRKENGLLTSLGEWGPWINGGGWLKVQSLPVDILYRDLEAVNSVFRDCLEGRISISYQPGHPHGFVSSIYFAEIASCRILFDKFNIISKLKEKTSPYPEALKRGLITKFLWEAGFSAQAAKKGIAYGDVSYIAGSFFRAISCLNQVLFALNEIHWMNEKGAVRTIAGFRIYPDQYEKRVNQIFSRLVPSRKHLNNSIKLLTELIGEVTTLVPDQLNTSSNPTAR